MMGNGAEREQEECEQDRREAAVARFGRTSTACVALGTHISVWWASRVRPGSTTTPALVAYAHVPGAMVAAGEPVAAESDLVVVAEAFVSHAHASGRRACFFATEGRLAASPALQRRLLGEQPVWDPRRWGTHVAEHRSLREQLRRARAKGVVVRAIGPEEMRTPPMQEAVGLLVRRWRATRSMPPMQFLVAIDLESGGVHRQQFVAEQNGQLVALLSLAEVPARSGWLFEHLLRDPDAPNGTLELLVDQVMRQLSASGVAWATLGLAPLHGDVQGSWRLLRTWSTPLFNFAGLAAFKRKLRPDYWEPMYLAWPVGQSGTRALLDGLRAFAGGALWRFGVRTVLRGPAPLLSLLELLLVPWTMALALAPTARWFPSPAVHVAWVVFDVALIVALRTVRTGQRRTAQGRARVARTAAAVAAAVSLDALITIVQALWWNIPRLTAAQSSLTGTWDVMSWLVVLVACGGPLLAAAVLWGAARRLRTLAAVRPRLVSSIG